MQAWDDCKACYERAKEGFKRLLGGDSAKGVGASFSGTSQIQSAEERIAEYRRFWEMAKVSLPDDAVTYNVANEVGIQLYEKGKYEETKVFYLTALEGGRRVHGEEHKSTLDSLSNMGTVLDLMKDYAGALDYFEQALRGSERVLGKTHPDTLMTLECMADLNKDVRDFTKAEELYRLALDCNEKLLGKHHEYTKKCARNLSNLREEMERLDE